MVKIQFSTLPLPPFSEFWNDFFLYMSLKVLQVLVLPSARLQTNICALVKPVYLLQINHHSDNTPCNAGVQNTESDNKWTCLSTICCFHQRILHSLYVRINCPYKFWSDLCCEQGRCHQPWPLAIPLVPVSLHHLSSYVHVHSQRGLQIVCTSFFCSCGLFSTSKL